MLRRVLSFDNSIKGVVGGGYTPCVGIGGGAAPFDDAVEKNRTHGSILLVELLQ